MIIFALLFAFVLSSGFAMAEESNDDGDVLQETSGDVDADNSTQESGESDDAADVEIDMDVMFDEDDEDANETDVSLKAAHNQIELEDYATSNPILLALLVMFISIIIPFRRL